MDRGKLTSASMLANGPAVQEAVGGALRFAGCSYGVHLNATEFRPLRFRPDLSPIVNGDRCFSGKLREIGIGFRLLRAIYEEWCAQIERLADMGIEPTHIDSHQHVHTLPQMLPVLRALRKRYGIPIARASRNIYSDDRPASKALLAKKRLFNCVLRRYCGYATTEGFTDLPTFLSTYRNRAPLQKSIEIMVHPGASGSEEETKTLQNDCFGSLPFPIRTISYRQLRSIRPGCEPGGAHPE